MGVHLRKKPLRNGKQSLYLDYFPPILNPVTGKKTRREFLKMYIFDNPNTSEEKLFNKGIMIKAEEICAIRQRQVFNEELGVYDNFNRKKDFLSYFLKLAEEKAELTTRGNYLTWMSTYMYLTHYTDGQCKVGDLNEQFCKNFRGYMLTAHRLKRSKKKLKQNSASSYFSKFKAAIRQAFEDRLINEDYSLRVKGIPQEETDREFLTVEELGKLSKIDCEVPKLKEACLFAALTGLRWGDVSRLKWADLQYSQDMGNFIYKKNEKGKKNDHHPISKQAVSILGEKGVAKDRVFIGLVYSDYNNKQIEKWIHEAGINKKITFHNFRHTYATILLSSGTDVATVNKLLNHSHIKTTMIYAKVLGHAKKDAANSINIDL